jgi:DedD protein
MAGSEDTEITLGTGKMLGLFFGLVIVCAVFFSLGFSFGRNSVKMQIPNDVMTGTSSNGGPRPSAVKPVSTASSPSGDQLTFYKAVEQKDASAQLTPVPANNDSPSAQSTPSADNKPPVDQTTATAANGYYVQVAAVSKQEDAEALVDALKKKQYPAFSANNADKLFHVQVGPFGDVKDAETMRGKLVADGYNPILKK